MRGKKIQRTKKFLYIKSATVLRLYASLLKGKVMQIEKALTNDRLGVSKVS